MEVDRSITAERVLDVLTNLFLTRGVPQHIRSDNGPEFIAMAIRRHGVVRGSGAGGGSALPSPAPAAFGNDRGHELGFSTAPWAGAAEAGTEAAHCDANAAGVR